ncbi:tRNA pseudouridine(38-40) synthase TruA [Helicobacter mustelae]|nr:tRNA pseudouridine(38-40) synthase TruA [Helicobacter mustelae]SQH71306.1 tRNA pseudouridine synthase [Helicobacter mustelae]STP12432.1 tRNA pseudouridine synthase [Helicobacter mustelae]
MFIAAKIAYDGSKFFGFAKQDDGHKSVVQALEFALKSLGITSNIIGAGRTDRGVHATGQVIRVEIPDFWELERLRNLLNQKLHPSIFLRRIWRVEASFHPRFSAKKREYRYIFGNYLGNVWMASYVSWERYGDKKRISEALNLFVGKRDFGYFCKSGSDNKTTIRQIYHTRLYTHQIFKHDYLVACIQANGFLYGQIRLMMGAVLAYSRKELTYEELELQVLAKKRFYSIPASPNGLYLSKIFY